MTPSSVINSVRVARLDEHEYGRVATYLRELRPKGRRSYAPYIGSVYELDDLAHTVAFQDELLLPEEDSGRPRVLLVISNAHPESIKNGMFHTAESGIAELWLDLRAVGLLAADDATLGSPPLLRNLCLTAGYAGSFCLGFICYWIFPTFHPDHLKKLFGAGCEPRGFEDTRGRFKQCVETWRPSAIISFHGGVFERLTGESSKDYTRWLRKDLLFGELPLSKANVPVFQTYPAAWRYDKQAGHLRRESLARIVRALSRKEITPSATC